MVEHKPVDHSEATKDTTIFGVVQQIIDSDGYIVAKVLTTSLETLWCIYNLINSKFGCHI